MVAYLNAPLPLDQGFLNAMEAALIASTLIALWPNWSTILLGMVDSAGAAFLGLLHTCSVALQHPPPGRVPPPLLLTLSVLQGV